MHKANPYRPGAGLEPVYLAGRENEIMEAEQMFEALLLNIPTKSIIYSGLRGVGKTVLINKLQKVAEDKGVFCKHIEVEDRKDFISQIAACSQMFLREVSTREKLKDLLDKALTAIKSLVISFDSGNNTFSLSMQERELYTSTNLTQSLTELFVSIGKIAYNTKTPVCFFVDEIQYMEEEELGSLIAALHRANQLGYPVMIIGAGLPKIYSMLSKVKSYTERLFLYKEIDSLTEEQSKYAIIEPAKALKVDYTEEAVEKIVSVTKGYPFFIQQFCEIIYNNVDGRTIVLKDVEESLPILYKILDTGFFKVRYERCSEGEKKFLYAMVKCDELPCTISNVAQNLNKTVKSISPTRAQLISKGVIYGVRHSELDFTVPEFEGFIERLEEYKAWKKERKKDK